MSKGANIRTCYAWFTSIIFFIRLFWPFYSNQTLRHSLYVSYQKVRVTAYNMYTGPTPAGVWESCAKRKTLHLEKVQRRTARTGPTAVLTTGQVSLP